MKAGNFPILFTGTWMLSSLSGCASTTMIPQTPTESNPPLPASINSSTPEENNDGSELYPPLISVPTGVAPTMDGALSPGEWNDAAAESFADGSQLLLLQAGDYIYLAIRAIESEMIASNIFISRGDEIAILHASAALGTAIYQKGADGWQQVQDFSWRCRSTGNSQAAIAEHAKFLEDEGWLAANGLMGTPNELEYQIRIPDQDFSLAVVYIKTTYPYEKVPWPVKLVDDCIQPSSGGLPPELQFSPAQWARLDLSR